MFDKIKNKLGLTPKAKVIQEESQLNIAIGYKDNKVIMNFGKPVSFISMDKLQCTGVIEALLKTQSLIK